MLIDVSRRPARLIFEECPGLVVIRSMKVTGDADGLVHRWYKIQGSMTPLIQHVKPQATLVRGNRSFMETILPLGLMTLLAPTEVNQVRPVVIVNGTLRTLMYEPPPSPEDEVKMAEPFQLVSGCDDQITGFLSNWRINFIFNKGKKGVAFLSLQDESSGTMLCTVQLNMKDYAASAPRTAQTPLRRYLSGTTVGEEQTIWSALQEDDEI